MGIEFGDHSSHNAPGFAYVLMRACLCSYIFPPTFMAKCLSNSCENAPNSVGREAMGWLKCHHCGAGEETAVIWRVQMG